MRDLISMINSTENPDALIASMPKWKIAAALDLIAESGAGMRLDKLQKLTASISPDLVSNTLTQNITASLLEAYYSWSDDWKKIATIGSSDYLDQQVIERVAQLGMLDKLDESGESLNQINIGDADQITYQISGFANIVVVDLRTKRSDRLQYFDDLGSRLGRAAASRLHNTIFVDYLQSNPTVDDGNSLFDDTNHGNDMDSGGSGNALTYDNVVAAFRKLDAMTDDAGEPIGSEGAYLVTGRYWREIADQIVKNPSHPGTGNRDVNTIKERIIDIIYSRKNNYDWYLVADPKELPGLHIDFFEGVQEPKVDAERSDSTFQFEHPGRQRWRIYHYYGLVWKYWQAAVRGSTNTI